MNWNGKVKIVTVNTKERKEGGNGMEAGEGWTCNGISRRGKKEEEKTEGKEMEEQIEKGRRECFNGEKMGMDDPMKKNEIEH
uniref:Uncharacterized protein n=1 Tax=Pristionchus pacificus TaxID=54126 RepID=A0A2A6BYV0_PRIPA|eukprot:PDM71070.1 hypothetical protein PRIPAC_44466 [Pristionchus pacificus]